MKSLARVASRTSAPQRAPLSRTRSNISRCFSTAVEGHLPGSTGCFVTKPASSLDGYQTEFVKSDEGHERVRIYQPSGVKSTKGDAKLSPEYFMSPEEYNGMLREQGHVEAYTARQEKIEELVGKAKKEMSDKYLPKDNKSVTALSSMGHYEYLVYERPELLVFFFHAKFSLQAKVLLPQFQQLAAAGGGGGKAMYFSVDVDEVPRAAYHADVDDVPTIVVMHNDDAYRQKIAPIEFTDCTTLISRAQAAITGFTPPPEGEKLPKKASAMHHNIPIDHLNAIRIGWATPSEA